MTRPTHELILTRKEPLRGKTVGGVAWVREGPYGPFISITLNPGVVISHRDLEDHMLGLFPVDADRRWSPRRATPNDPGADPFF